MEAEIMAWNNKDRDGAHDLIARYPETFAHFEGLSLESVVQQVSDYRAAGQALQSRLADIWAQARFGPQRIKARMG